MSDVSALLPDEVVEGLRQIAEQGEGIQWSMGDYLVAVVDEFEPYIEPRTPTYTSRTEIVKQLADRTGLDTSTLRDREMMARFYPKEVRERYSPLTYYQLKACKSAGGDWQRWADWALANLPAPVDVIRAKIKVGNSLMPLWLMRLEKIEKIAQQVNHDGEAPDAVQVACASIAGMAKGMYEAFTSMEIDYGYEKEKQR